MIRPAMLAAILFCACAQSSAPLDGSAPLDAALDTASDGNAVDSSACLPLPPGRDCFPAGAVPDGGCQTHCSFPGMLRATDASVPTTVLCVTGAACTVDDDCACIGQACTSGICWF